MADPEPRLKPWILLGLPVMLVLLVAVLAYLSETPAEPPARRHEIAYTDFRNLVEQGNVEEIVLRGEFFSISGSEFIEVFVGVGASRVRQVVDRAVRDLLQEGEERALLVIRRCRASLQRLVRALERDESLDRVQIEACLGRRETAMRYRRDGTAEPSERIPGVAERKVA